MTFIHSHRERQQELIIPQNIGTVLDGCEVSVDLAATEINPLQLNVTGQDFDKLFNSILIGSQFVAPTEYLRLTALFLQAGLCLPTFEGEPDDCFNYLPYAPFIHYDPYNPYSEPDTIPQGYLKRPYEWGDGILYELTDLLVDFASFPLLANWFSIINGFLPQFVVNTVGDGQIELDFLNTVQGGMVVMKDNSPPNILDIIGGIFGADIRIIDLMIDIAIPSELDPIHAEEWDVEVGAGVPNALYCTFFPVVDDIFPPFGLPLRFGGGIRRIGLCGFEGAGEIMGITDLRRVGEKLEVFDNGQWVEKVDLQPLHDSLQAQITSNDVDILALQVFDGVLVDSIADVNDFAQTHENQISQNIMPRLDALELEDINLQGQITTNDTDITNLQNEDINLQTQIDNNDIDIADIYLSIAQLNLNDADHLARIIALESADDYAGSDANADHHLWEADYASQTQFSTGVGVWHTLVDLDKTIVLKENNVYIELTYYIQAKVQTGEDVIFRVTDGTSSVIMAETNGLSGNAWDSSRLTGYFSGLSAGSTTFQLQWTHAAGGELRLRGLQKAQALEVYNSDPTPVIFGGSVTFDSGGKPYTLLMGDVSPIGNPGNCIERDAMTIGQYVEFEFDITGLTINDLLFDIFRAVETVSVNLYVDDVPIVGISSGQYIIDQWTSFSAITEVPGSFPLPAGDVLRIRGVATGNGAEIRLDNIETV